MLQLKTRTLHFLSEQLSIVRVWRQAQVLWWGELVFDPVKDKVRFVHGLIFLILGLCVDQYWELLERVMLRR